MPHPYVEIDLPPDNVTAAPQTYRFYGLGAWKVKTKKGWEPINGIYVPAEALKIAADQCNAA